MVVFNNALAGAAGQAGGAAAGFKIERSLRFNDDDSASLTKTFASAGNRKTFTFSLWVKRSTLGKSYTSFISNTDASGLNGLYFNFASDYIQFSEYGASGWVWNTSSEGLYRDPNAWYHIVAVVDTTQTTQSDRVKVYVNGAQITFATGSSYPSLNHDVRFNDNALHAIGRQGSNTNTAYMYDGYMADFYFIDGQALAAADFGEYDNNGVWQPKAYTGTYKPQVNNSQDWSSSPYNSGNTSDANYPATNAFNGSIGTTYTDGWLPATGNTITWTSDSNFSSATSVRIYYIGTGGGALTVNGNSVTTNNDGTVRSVVVDVTGTGFSGFTNSWVSSPNGPLAVLAVEVDGVRLVDTTVSSATSNSYHLDFSDNSSDAALGDDSSGNNNDWTVNNLSSATTVASGKTSISYATVATDFPGTATNDQSSASFTNTWTVGTGLTIGSYIIIDTGGASHAVDITPYGSDASISYSDDLINWTTGASTTASSSFTEGRYYWIQSTPSAYGGGLTLTSASTPDGDSVLDSPTNYDDETNIGGNYCTLNPLDKHSSVTLSNGNLAFSSGATPNVGVRSTIWITSGKWYWEVTNVTGGGNYSAGIANKNWPRTYVGVSDSFGMGSNGTPYPSLTGGNNLDANDAGDVLGIAFDADNGSLEMYVNGSTQNFAQGWTIGDGPWSPAFGTVANNTPEVNFGQRDFAYTPPTGYKALCTQNFDDPEIADGSDYFDIALWNGDNTSPRDITGFSFKPDLVWTKNRSYNYYNNLYDTTRGVRKPLHSCQTLGEDTTNDALYGGVSDFNSDGFELTAGNDGSNPHLWTNETGSSFIAWAWDAGNAANPTSISAGGENSSVYDQSQTWSSYISGNVDSSYPATNMFDGDTGTSYSTGTKPATGESLTWTPTTAITGVETLEIGIYGNQDFEINGTSITPGSAGGQVISVDKSTYFSNGTLSSISWEYTDGSNYVYVTYIKVNGKILTDSGVTVPTNVPSVATTVRANPSAGFSICTYSGTGNAETFAHGLNAAPEFILIKRRNGSNNWNAFHKSITGMNGGYLHFNTSNPFAGSYTDIWNSTDPTSAAVSVGTDPEVGANTGTYVAYCWAPVEGYSAFGSYTGNQDTSGDGPFVYTGFRPALVMIKAVSTGETGWAFVQDSAREPSNVSDTRLFWGDNYSEVTATGLGGSTSYEMDILSNGFKIRNAHNESNILDKQYVYACWAENPFKTSRAR